MQVDSVLGFAVIRVD